MPLWLALILGAAFAILAIVAYKVLFASALVMPLF